MLVIQVDIAIVNDSLAAQKNMDPHQPIGIVTDKFPDGRSREILLFGCVFFRVSIDDYISVFFVLLNSFFEHI